MISRIFFSVVALIIYIFLFLYYVRMELFTLLLIFRRGIQNIVRRSEKEEMIFRLSIREIIKLFEQSLFFNHSLAILSMILVICIVAYLPTGEKLKLQLLTIITSTVPYVWSYFRAANVGINGGIIGSLIGLSIFAWKIGNIEWFFFHTPHFLLFSFLANMSGWLGGWVGSGQIREAVYVIVGKLKIGDEGSSIQNLTDFVEDTVQALLESEYKNEIKYIINKPSLDVLESADNCSVVSYRHEMEWRLVERPQKKAIGWLFKKEIPSTNIIIDNMFNLFRSQVTKIVFLGESNPCDGFDEEDDQSVIHMLIVNYKETPAIVWVDDEVKVLSDRLKIAINENFSEHSDKIQNHQRNFLLRNITQFAYRTWRENITLEQYSKETYGSTCPYEAIYENQLGITQNIPILIMNEISKASTFFDQFRGNLLTFIAFLFAQVIVAVVVNIASEGLASGLW